MLDPPLRIFFFGISGKRAGKSAQERARPRRRQRPRDRGRPNRRGGARTACSGL